MDQWFEQFAQEQYTRELLFSTVVSVMLEVVCGPRKSVNAAYQAMAEAIPVSIQAVYDQLRGVEPGVAAELVRYAARGGQDVITALAGASPPLLPGYSVRMLDGNHLAATEHRLKELRSYGGGALPGLALVVYDPDQDRVMDVVPCENGHTQERALLKEWLATVAPGQVWIMDRNFCVLAWLHQIAARSAYFVVREHEQTPFTVLGPCGRSVKSKRVGSASSRSRCWALTDNRWFGGGFGCYSVSPPVTATTAFIFGLIYRLRCPP